MRKNDLKIETLHITDSYMQHNYYKNLICEITEDIIYFLSIYPLLSMINLNICHNNKFIYEGMTIIVPVLLMTFARMKIKKRILFDITVFVIAIFTSVIFKIIPYNNIFWILIFICAVISIIKSKKNQRMNFKIINLIAVQIILLFELTIAVALQLKVIQNLILLFASVTMIISCAYICKARNVRLSRDNIGNKTFKKRNTTMFAVEIAILLSLFTAVLQFTGVFKAANSVTVSMVNQVRGLGEGVENHSDASVIQRAKSITSKSYIGDRPVEKEDSNIVEKIFYSIVGIAIVIFLITMLIVIFKFLCIVLNDILIKIKAVKNNDKVTFIWNEKDESDTTDNKKLNRTFKINIFKTPAEKVRAIYKKRVNSYIKQQVSINNNCTVDDIKNNIFNKTGEDIDNISRIYEKARYSNKVIDKSDVEKMKM